MPQRGGPWVGGGGRGMSWLGREDDSGLTIWIVAARSIGMPTAPLPSARLTEIAARLEPVAALLRGGSVGAGFVLRFGLWFVDVSVHDVRGAVWSRTVPLAEIEAVDAAVTDYLEATARKVAS